MSSYIKLDDGTEFRFQFGGRSGKAVLVGFSESELEKLLSLGPDKIVEADGENMSYVNARNRLKEIVAYIPDPRDWLRLCNYL